MLREKLNKKWSRAELLKLQKPFLQELMNCLGYSWLEQLKETEEGLCPIVGEVCNSDGSPLLWMLTVAGESQETTDPLGATFITEQYPDDTNPKQKLLDEDIENLITRQIFTVAEPPRWIMLFNLDALILIDRSKWSEKRLLRFDRSVLLLL